MSCDDYILGRTARFREQFSVGKKPADPDEVKFIYQAPGDASPTVLTYGSNAALARESTGAYHVDLTFDKAGDWLWRWESSGVVSWADQGTITVVDENPVG